MRKFVTVLLLLNLFFFLCPEQLYVANEMESISSGCIPVQIYSKDSNGKILEKTICMTVLSPKTIVNQEKKEVIDAQDAIVPKDTIEKASNEELIDIAKAKAWVYETGEPIPITIVKKVKINNNPNSYQITFSTAKGTNVTSNMIERKENHPQSSTNIENETYINFSNYESIFLKSLYNIVLWLLVLISITIYLYIHIKRREKKVLELIYENKSL